MLKYSLWAARFVAAAILIQTLFFKFSGAEESVYIFSTLGVEPIGRWLTGALELIAGLLLLLKRRYLWGALLSAFIMFGAVLSHAFILGIEVKADSGQLFFMALIVLLSSLYILYQERQHVYLIYKKIKS